MSDNKQMEAQPQQTEQTQEQATPEVRFTQEQVDNILKARLSDEKRKTEKIIAEQERQKKQIEEEQQIKEAKSKQEIEKIMQAKLAEKDKEIQSLVSEMKAERIDKKILEVASTMKAIVPDQIVSLLKTQVQLGDGNRIEVLDNNGNLRYNEKGQPLSIEERVKEFLDSNPHFRQGSLSGSGSQSAIGGNSQKPLSIGDLDLNNPADRKVYAEMRKSKAGFKLNPKLTINN